MGDVFAKVRLAAVQAAPIFLNRKATVDKAIALIKQAGANGADIVGFPENFIPGHPLWYYYDLPSSDRSMSFATELYKNAVVIESDDVGRLCCSGREYLCHHWIDRKAGEPNRRNVQYAALHRA